MFDGLSSFSLHEIICFPCPFRGKIIDSNSRMIIEYRKVLLKTVTKKSKVGGCSCEEIYKEMDQFYTVHVRFCSVSLRGSGYGGRQRSEKTYKSLVPRR